MPRTLLPGGPVPPPNRPLDLGRRIGMRVALLRSLAGLLLAAIIGWQPASIGMEAASPVLALGAIAWVLLTSLPRFFNSSSTRLAIVLADVALLTATLTILPNVLLLGALVPAVVIATCALPLRLLGTGGIVAVGWAAMVTLPTIGPLGSLFVAGMTACVVVLVGHARRETLWQRHLRAVEASSPRHVARQVTEQAASVRRTTDDLAPARHDLSGAVHGMHAMAELLARCTGDTVSTSTRALVDAQDRLRRRLDAASRIAVSTLELSFGAGITTTDTDDRGRDRPALLTAMAIVRAVAIGLLALVLLLRAEDPGQRLLVLALGMTSVTVSLPWLRWHQHRGVNLALHASDTLLLLVAELSRGGLDSLIASAMFVHVALIAVNVLRPADRVGLMLGNWSGLVAVGILTAGPGLAGFLLAGFWATTISVGHLWVLALHRDLVRSDADNLALRRQETRHTADMRQLERLGAQVESTIDEFGEVARRATAQCQAVARRYVGRDDRAGRVAAVLGQEADHLLALLDELDGRRRGPHHGLTPVQVDASTVIDHALGSDVIEGHVVIDDEAGDALVVTDPHLVARCVRNLVDNALRHRRRRPVRVHHTVDRSLGRWIITVVDDGPGLDAAEFERLCRKYVQRAGDTHTGQHGLGLWIVRSIVTALGGSVTARRRQDGFAVALTLPQHGHHLGPPAATIQVIDVGDHGPDTDRRPVADQPSAAGRSSS